MALYGCAYPVPVEGLPHVDDRVHVEHSIHVLAGLIIIIWGLAGPALSGVFQQAIDRVSGF
ncbi:hypothetical protein E3O48_13485 [Cryobacterium sp. HLT2-28]|nr:hypothetical protein E3O48_13485 [Cryobacterium sp. HLT2-28]